MPSHLDSSPSSKVRSVDPVRTKNKLSAFIYLIPHFNLRMFSSGFGEKTASLTDPLCPGNLNRSLPVFESHIVAVPSPPPATIFAPLGSQEALNRFFSMPDGAPSKVLICLLVGANGRISQVRTVESCELERSVCESGDTRRDVMVSLWPINEYTTARFRMSHTLISLSIPPEYSSFPASDSATAVTGKSVSIKSIAAFCRVSQI